MTDSSNFTRRYLEAPALPGVEPLFEDFAIGHPITMGIEEPHDHERQATQAIHTFPFTGEQMLGFEDRKHADFRKVVFPAFSKRAVPGYDAALRRHALAGVAIPAGSLTILCLAAANREPGGFGSSDPDRWALDRRPVGHIAFSVGEHSCLGAHLARAELPIGLEVLLERLPGLRLVESPVFLGAAIRGPKSVCVAWDAASAPRLAAGSARAGILREMRDPMEHESLPSS